MMPKARSQMPKARSHLNPRLVPSVQIPATSVLNLPSDAGKEILPHLLPTKVELLPHLGMSDAAAQYTKLCQAVQNGIIDRICFVDADGALPRLFPKGRTGKLWSEKRIAVVDECPQTFFIIFANTSAHIERLEQDGSMKDFGKALHCHDRVWCDLTLPVSEESVDYRLYCAASVLKHNPLFEKMKYLVCSQDTFMVIGPELPCKHRKNEGYNLSLVEYLGSPTGSTSASEDWYMNAISLRLGDDVHGYVPRNDDGSRAWDKAEYLTFEDRRWTKRLIRCGEFLPGLKKIDFEKAHELQTQGKTYDEITKSLSHAEKLANKETALRYRTEDEVNVEFAYFTAAINKRQVDEWFLNAETEFEDGTVGRITDLPDDCGYKHKRPSIQKRIREDAENCLKKECKDSEELRKNIQALDRQVGVAMSPMTCEAVKKLAKADVRNQRVTTRRIADVLRNNGHASIDSEYLRSLVHRESSLSDLRKDNIIDSKQFEVIKNSKIVHESSEAPPNLMMDGSTSDSGSS